MDDLKNLTAEKVIPVTPEKQEQKMSWELTITLPKKQEEEVLLWQPYQTPKGVCRDRFCNELSGL